MISSAQLTVEPTAASVNTIAREPRDRPSASLLHVDYTRRYRYLSVSAASTRILSLNPDRTLYWPEREGPAPTRFATHSRTCERPRGPVLETSPKRRSNGSTKPLSNSSPTGPFAAARCCLRRGSSSIGISPYRINNKSQWQKLSFIPNTSRSSLIGDFARIKHQPRHTTKS